MMSTAQFHGYKEPEGWGKGLQGALLDHVLAQEPDAALPLPVLQSGEGMHAPLVDLGCCFILAGKGEPWPWPSPSVIIISMN